jgi:hypothetical protein
MRLLWTSALLTAVFGLALAVGFETAAAAPALDTPDAAFDLTFDLDAALGEGERGERGDRVRGRVCQRLARRVHRACPACGPNAPEDGWKNHGQFVSCVNGALNDILQNLPDDLPEGLSDRIDECAKQIRERAAQSEVGKPGWECPDRSDRPAPGDRRNPGGGGR